MNKRDYGSGTGRGKRKAQAGSARGAAGGDGAGKRRRTAEAHAGRFGSSGDEGLRRGAPSRGAGAFTYGGIPRGAGDRFAGDRRDSYGPAGGSYEGKGMKSAKAFRGKPIKTGVRGASKRGSGAEHPARKPAGRSVKEPYVPKEEARWNDRREVLEREDRIEGRNPVLEALRSERPVNKLFIEKDNTDASLMRIAAMAREKGIPIQYVERRKLDAMSSARIHQGVILEAAQREYAEVSDILRIAAEKGEDPFIVILDGITDTNNFGSIIRSAECAGVHGIIIPKRRSATLNATVAKVAAGAQEYVAIARVANLTQAIRELKDSGVWITAADPDGDRPYYESDLTGPVALVIGSEGEGISRVVRDECDYLVKIPMKGRISSLNAGVAAGLIMFEISRRRN